MLAPVFLAPENRSFRRGQNSRFQIGNVLTRVLGSSPVPAHEQVFPFYAPTNRRVLAILPDVHRLGLCRSKLFAPAATGDKQRKFPRHRWKCPPDATDQERSIHESALQRQLVPRTKQPRKDGT